MSDPIAPRLQLQWDSPFSDSLKSFLIAFCATTFYILVMLWSYATVESDLFAYRGLILNSPPIEWTIVSFILAWSVLPLLPKSLDKPSDIASIVLYTVVLIPCLFIPYHISGYPPARVLVFILTFWVAFISFLCVLRTKVRELVPSAIPQKTVLRFLVMGCLALSLLILALNGFRINLDFSDVYDRRLAARETVAGGSLAGFALAFLNTVFAPLCVIYGVTKRKWIVAGVGCFGLLTIFSLSGTKSTIFTPLFVLGLYWVMSRSRKNLFRNFLLVCTMGILVSAGQYIVLGKPYLSAFFTDRLIVTRGAALTHYWLSFENDPVLMGDSSIASVFGVKPRAVKSFEVGAKYGFGQQDNYIGGLWPSMYANFGVIGFFVASFGAAFVLKLFDAMSCKRNLLLLSSITGLIGLTWCDAALETSLLSNGIVLLLAFGYLLRDRLETPE